MPRRRKFRNDPIRLTSQIGQAIHYNGSWGTGYSLKIGRTTSVQGNYFYGSRGSLHVNRQSYTYRLMPNRGVIPARDEPRGGTPPAPAFEPFNTKFAYVGGPSDSAHIRN